MTLAVPLVYRLGPAIVLPDGIHQSNLNKKYVVSNITQHSTIKY